MEKNILMTKIEQLLYTNNNLLEIAKAYCEYHYDKASEVVALSSILEITLKNQKEIIDDLDSLLVC